MLVQELGVLGSQVIKFEQVSSDHHQMSVAEGRIYGGWICWG